MTHKEKAIETLDSVVRWMKSSVFDYELTDLEETLNEVKEDYKKYLKAKTKNVYCTKIASKLTRTYTDKHGLLDLTKDLMGITLNKTLQRSDWGSEELSKDQLNYAANDVINLHKLKTKLDKMLVRDKRVEIAKKCFEFLETQVELDLKGFEEDIFSH